MTDNSSLVGASARYFSTHRSQRIAIKLETLLPYNLTFHHLKGTENSVADTLFPDASTDFM